MGRYARAFYGTSKYGLDKWAEHSVEPMVAAIEVDPSMSQTAATVDTWGDLVYDRVQVSWLAPAGIDRFMLLRSNLGYPTSPVDPFAKVLVDGDPTDPLDGVEVVYQLVNDPYGRSRYGFLDDNVETGRECFYAAWSYLENIDEWILAGRATVTTSTDHQTLQAFKGAMPAWMWNRHAGPGDGVSVLADDDDENHLTRWLQSCAWEIDKSLTKIDLLRDVWDPHYTPAILLDDAVEMFGLPAEPALGARSQRALLANAADITGGRGTFNSTSLLVESLTGFACDLKVGTNMIANPDESSFESMMVAPGTNDVVSGTGRWHFENATLTRVPGDEENSDVKIARDVPETDDEFGTPDMRFGLRLGPKVVGYGMEMSLGDKITVDEIQVDNGSGYITTKWVHGLEAGDQVVCRRVGTNYVVSVVSVVNNFTIQVETTLPDIDQKTTGDYLHGGMIPVYQGVPVAPGKIAALVGKFRSNGVTDISLAMTYWDRFGNLIHENSVSPTTPVDDLTWNKLYLADSAPQNANTVTLSITKGGSGTPGYFLGVDSLMVKPGGTPYSSPLEYTTSTVYEGAFDHTYEDARMLTIDIDVTHTPAQARQDNPQEIPLTIAADMSAVINARLTEILAASLPVGSAFRITGLPGI